MTFARFGPPDQHTDVYWLNRAERWVAAPLGATIFVLMGLAMLFLDGGDPVIGAAVLLLSIAWAARAMFYVQLTLGEDFLVIRNLRPRRIFYSDIEDVQPEYEGLVVKANGRRFVAIAIQRWNISLFLKRRTCADFVAQEIRRRVDLARPSLPDPLVGSEHLIEAPDFWSSEPDLNRAVMVSIPSLGAFVRSLFPVAMNGGHSLTYGVWVGLEPSEMERAFAEWWASTYPQLRLQGRLANAIPPWGLLG